MDKIELTFCATNYATNFTFLRPILMVITP